MKNYELVVLLHPDLEIDVDTPIAKIEKLVGNAGGKLTKKDNWGKKRLAYPISKQNFAVYVYFEVDMEPAKVRQLEAALLITEEVMRFLMVNKVDIKQKPEKAGKAKPAAVAVDSNEEDK
ncbi:MAG TPA: 30S ribosomal protein S6 [Candidatus Saccharimonadales bacterium]|nr:30S ribosomal protein S6 [Candidatus Saccharimonadales bacterium]